MFEHQGGFIRGVASFFSTKFGHNLLNFDYAGYLTDRFEGHAARDKGLHKETVPQKKSLYFSTTLYSDLSLSRNDALTYILSLHNNVLREAAFEVRVSRLEVRANHLCAINQLPIPLSAEVYTFDNTVVEL